MTRTPIKISTLAAWLTGLLAIHAGVPGCDASRCVTSPSIVPGVGVNLDGAVICLGDGQKALEQQAVAGVELRDLGQAGHHFSMETSGISGTLQEVDGDLEVTGINLYESGSLLTPEGVGFDSDTSEVEAAYGPAVLDPFLGTWRYPRHGIAFVWQAGQIQGIQVSHPASD